MRVLLCIRINDGRFDAADGDSLGLPTRNGNFEVVGVAGDDAIRPQIWRCQRRLDATSPDKDVGARVEVVGKVEIWTSMS